MRLNWKKLTRPERIEVLKSGIARNLSAQQTADELDNCTRNMLIGLSHRLKMPFGGKSGPKAAEPKEPARTGTKTRPLKSLAVVKRKRDNSSPKKSHAKPTLKDLAQPVIRTGPVNILDVGMFECRNPMWDDRKKNNVEDWLFCGKPTKPGSSYCEACHSRFYFKTNRQRQAAEKELMAIR